MGIFQINNNLSKLAKVLSKEFHQLEHLDGQVQDAVLLKILALSIISEITETKPISTLLEKDPFLKSVATNGSEFNIRFQRMLFLGEMLYNLQEVKGINEVVKKIGKNDIEPLFAELEAGKLLKISGYNFQYLPPLGSEKTNDLEIYDGKGILSAEIKCKVSETKFSSKTIENSLYKANDQLSANDYNLIFLKLRQDWMDDNHKKDLIEKILKDFLEKTKRYVTIIVYYNTYQKKMNNDYTYGVSAFERSSENVFEIRDQQILFPTSNNWLNISNIAQKLKENIQNEL